MSMKKIYIRFRCGKTKLKSEIRNLNHKATYEAFNFIKLSSKNSFS